MIVIAVVCLAFIGLSTSQGTEHLFDCSIHPNNREFFYWWACGAYGICRNGEYMQVDCVNGTSFDRIQKQCVHNDLGVTFPCNGGVNCSHDMSHGHRYPDEKLDPVEGHAKCTFYYTCAHGNYLGHQMCNGGFVYDEFSQSCKNSTLVPPPCGTYKPDDENYYSF